jgi:hypothetical protein
VGSFISIGDNLVALIISSVPEVCRAPPPLVYILSRKLHEQWESHIEIK